MLLDELNNVAHEWHHTAFSVAVTGCWTNTSESVSVMAAKCAMLFQLHQWHTVPDYRANYFRPLILARSCLHVNLCEHKQHTAHSSSVFQGDNNNQHSDNSQVWSYLRKNAIKKTPHIAGVK